MMDPLPKVLVVDDTASNILAIELILKDCDVEIVAASSGQEALKLSLLHNFALVLLDVEMPGMNGYETASLFRSSTRTRETPIIFVTAMHAERDSIFKAYESGAVDYILKPLSSVILRSKVKVFAETYLLKEQEKARLVKHEQEKAAEEKRNIIVSENQKLKAILENMMVGVAMADASGKSSTSWARSSVRCFCSSHSSITITGSRQTS